VRGGSLRSGANASSGGGVLPVYLALALAHPGLLADVARLDREIEQAPSAERYLKRASKYRQLERYAEAHADIDRAEGRGANPIDLAFERGLTLAASGKPEAGLAQLDDYLKLGGTSFEAHRVRSRALVQLGRPAEARLGFEKAFELAPDPETCLELAAFLEQHGWPADARRVLETGLSKLSGAVTIRQALIALLRRTGQTRDALAQARAAAAGQPPLAQIEWRILAGEILIDRKEVAAARKELAAVRAELDAALARRSNGLQVEARDRVVQLLASISKEQR